MMDEPRNGESYEEMAAGLDDLLLSAAFSEDVRVMRLRVSGTVEGPARCAGRGLRARADDLVFSVSS
jgi:hypothetical protein